MVKYEDTPFWAYVRKSIKSYNDWLKDIGIENQCLMKSGKGGIDAFMEYEDTDRESTISMIRGAVKFGACTGEEYRQALFLIRKADEEFRRGLMKMELEAYGEI